MKPLETDHQVSTPSAPVNRKVMKPRYLVVTFEQITEDMYHMYYIFTYIRNKYQNNIGIATHFFVYSNQMAIDIYI